MKQDKNRKVYISMIAIIILVAIIVNTDYKPYTQTVIPECFETEECRTLIKTGYCDVKYDCIQGKCYSQQIKCPEVCYGEKDEDLDGLADCLDSDCFDSIYCSCYTAGFDACNKGECYCAAGNSQWIVVNGNGECTCT
jgi:hypothetical protein